MSDHITAVGHITCEGDAHIVSELTDDIRDAIVDYQVNSALKQFMWLFNLGKTGLDSTPTGHI